MKEDYDGVDHSTINTIIRVESVVAILACLSIIFIYVRFSDMQTPTYSFVFFMAMTGIGSECSDLMVSQYVYNNKNWCTFQGFVGQFFDVASVLWATVIAKSLYIVIVEQRTITKEFMIKCHAFVWGLTSILSLLPFTTDSYGQAGPWCWIKAPQTDQVKQRLAQDMGTTWRAFVFYIPIWICFFYVVYCYSNVIKTIRNFANLRDLTRSVASRASSVEEGISSSIGQTSNSKPLQASSNQSKLLPNQAPDSSAMRKMADSLYWFPVAFIGAWLVATCVRIYRWITGANQNDFNVRVVLGIFGNGSVIQAVANAIVYNSTGLVRAHWAEVAADILVCCGVKRRELSKSHSIKMKEDEDGDRQHLSERVHNTKPSSESGTMSDSDLAALLLSEGHEEEE